MPISRSDTVAPKLPQEDVACEALGGTVTVRGLTLTQQLLFSDERRALAEPREGEDAVAGRQRAALVMIPKMLAQCVLADDGEPLWGAQDWEAWGATHLADALQLSTVAMRLSGHDPGAAAKNS